MIDRNLARQTISIEVDPGLRFVNASNVVATQRLIVLDEAADELIEALEWYEGQRFVHGQQFQSAIDEAMGRLTRIGSEPSGRFVFWVQPCESRRMRLDLSHRITIVDPLTTVRTLVVLQSGNPVCFSFEGSVQGAANLFDLMAAAGRTHCDPKHSRFSRYSALLDDTRKP
jgi:hypothetical protein